MKALICAAAFALATPALAQEVVTHAYDGSYEDAAFAVENAIVGRGLVVDHVSHVGEMLARTGADVGSDEKLFENADIYMFCSAVISRKVMEADPLNIAYCPYSIFVFERDGEVVIGHRTFPEGAMDLVEELLSDIAAEALGG
jgi:uncharacterized protein (DUF302 family)